MERHNQLDLFKESKIDIYKQRIARAIGEFARKHQTNKGVKNGNKYRKNSKKS